jgi:hypothetical protein
MERALTPRVKKQTLLAALVVAGLSAGVLGVGAVRSAEPLAETHANDHGREGGGHRHWMHGGKGGRCEAFLEHIKDVDKKLSPEQVKDIVAGRLAQNGEGNLKVGKVATKSPGVVSVEIVTTSGSLVTTRAISQKTGLPAGLEKRCEERMAGKDEDGGHGPRGGGHMRGGMMRSLAALSPDGERPDLKLTTDQVKKLADAHLILTGNPRLKVGAVKEKDADTITVDIVTVDNALVVQREIDRHTGRPSRPD